MDAEFQIVDPKFVTTGDYVSFTVVDGPKRVPGRISRSALAVLDKGNNSEPSAIFEEHLEEIRKAAHMMRRVNPTLDVIFLASNDF
ncbi:hypothetical protein ACKZDW_10465 [Ralstonia syzygii subsp. celebesensis]|uniref:Uncharacterized protein n=2 Tax=Ralstonia syzygii subsp. celebesensis TaxID=1310168 RepID=A0A1U9VEF4_9RALS|nr:hypothetical protein [Ralstonia syzygii]AQW29064.1 hypothetical protein B0B51_02860 [blood disease bacterium A2-HR MARDI]QQV54393.1 hypothetical protein JK151_09260 [Ralstonia syzygii subsp. celebesensis]CCA79333.1 conserved hypothetical protein [blood disease bacterium R229]